MCVIPLLHLLDLVPGCSRQGIRIKHRLIRQPEFNGINLIWILSLEKRVF